MLIYLYDKNTKEYICNDIPQYDFIASDRLGYDSWITPPNSTFKEPPKVKENEVAIFNDSKDEWEIKEDYRGQQAYDKKTGKPYIISQIGSIPKGYSLEKPFILQEEKINKIKEVNIFYEEEQNKKVIVGKIEENIFVRSKLINLLDYIKEETFGNFEASDGSTHILTKEEINEYSQYFYLRSILLAIKKEEIVNNIRVCKSKAQLQKVETSFDIEEEINKVKNYTQKEFEYYIKERIK